MVDTVKILGALLGNGAVSKGSAGNVLGNVLGAALGGNQQGGSGGLGDLLGGLLGGGQQQQSGGGLGDLVGSVLGGGNKQRQQQSGGGAADILGSLLGGGQSKSGDLGGLGGLLGAAVSKYAQSQNPSAPAAKEFKWKKELPTGMKKQEAAGQAKLMIQAMINAAKSDGTIDDAEQQKIVSKLGDVSQDEIDFIRAEFAKPLDTNGFAHSVPSHLAQKVYAVSLLGIDLDTNKEAQYLHELAQCMHIEPEVANKIHEQLGAPKLYA